ncbi:hypothetical protein F5148DRAFT_1215526, partial [Russula earlei]
TGCENAASALALCTLLRAGRPSLQTVVVKGDIIITAATKNKIMTRSKTRVASPQFTRVPFPVEVLKLLLRELPTNGEVATLAAPTAPIDVESDDGDSDRSDEEKVKDDRVAFLSDVIGTGGVSFDEGDVLANDDEDFQKDPVSQIDLRVSSFIRESAGRDADRFGALVGQLSAEDMIVLERALQEQR